jgi:hypothetical protein
LEAYGDRTETVELIDPQETPKNVMLRAVRKRGGEIGIVNEAAMEEYRAAVTFFLRTANEAQERFLARGDVLK